MRRSNHHDRIIFNGHDLSNIVMCRMERPIMPPVEVMHETIGGRHGELFKGVRMQAYVQPVTVWLRTQDRRRVAEVRHKLAAMLWCDKPCPLYLPDDPTRYHLAVVSGDTNLGEITDELPSTTISFYVCDPIAYGNRRSEHLTTETVTIDAGGTFKSSPIIRSKTGGGTWRITNVTTGAFVEVSAATVGTNILSGSQLVCDMGLERLTINGHDVGVSVSSEFFTLDGRVALRVSGGTETTIDWIERWI